MRPKAQERGQALVIIALAAVGLFGFSALAIDGSRVFSDRRNAQNAADTSALSAALAKIRQEDYVTAAEERAADNGYPKDAIRTDVEVNLCNVTGLNPPCQGIPTETSTPPTAEELELTNAGNYIQVKITSILPATFARIVGRNEFTNILTAIAYAGPVEPKPLVDGYALAAMERVDWDAIQAGGSVTLQVHNSGIFSNSAYTQNGPNCNHGSMRTGGTSTVYAEFGIHTVGSFCQGGVGSVTGTLNPGASHIDYPPPVDIPDFSCSSNGSTSTDAEGRTIVSPGNHGNLNFQLGADVIFSPGTHCFNNGLTIGNFEDVTADYAKFLFKGGEFKLTGGTLTCNDLMVHIDGGRGISFGGSGKIFCNNVVFFLSSGGVTWNGNPEYRLYAPSGGDYEGLLFYMPASNDSPIRINGNAACEMTGTILAVSSAITVNGNSWTDGLNSQIIGDTVMLDGTGDLVLNFDPADQYQPIDPSAIMLTK